MLSKYEIQTKIDQFRKEGYWYQYIDFGNGIIVGHEKSKLRTNAALECVKISTRKKDIVLDIGCHAGIFSLEAGKKAKRVYGVDIDRTYIKMARFVKEALASDSNPFDNVTFHTLDITKRLDLIDKPTMILALKLFYHRNLKNNLSILIDKIKKSPNVTRILAQGHEIRGKFGNEQGTISVLKSMGFEISIVKRVKIKKSSHKENLNYSYPIILGNR